MSQLYAIMAWDHPDAPAKRMECRAAHFAYIETIMDKIVLAGPLKTDDGGFAGSLLIVKADNREAAEAILKSDPYYTGGVWARWDISLFVAAAGEWVEDKTW